jgi:hypothetical protein
MPKWKWRCPLRWTFFGLDDKYIENVYEQFFFLKYHGNWSFQEAYSLPVKIRTWFIVKLTDQLKLEQEAIKKK